MKTHILCLGDSNTHGYCADLGDNADGGIRFNEDERWTCRLQTALGDKYLVTEEAFRPHHRFCRSHPRVHGCSERGLSPAQEP